MKEVKRNLNYDILYIGKDFVCIIDYDMMERYVVNK